MPARMRVMPPFAALLLTSAALAHAPSTTPQPPPEPDKAQGSGPLQPATQPPPPEANLTGAPQGSKQAEKWWLWGDKRPSEWTVQIEPTVWYMGLGGDLRLGSGGGGTPFNVADVNMDDPQLSPAGVARLRGGDLTFTFSAFGYSGAESAGARAAFTAGGIPVAVGTPVRTEIDIVSGELAVGYEVYAWPGPHANGAPPDAEVRVDAYGGARFLNFSTDMTIGGAAVSDDGYTIHPLLGARLVLEMFDRCTVDVSVDAGYIPGGSRNATAINAVAGISYRPWGNVGLTFGYRILRIDMEDGSQSFDGSLAGLFANVVIRF